LREEKISFHTRYIQALQENSFHYSKEELRTSWCRAFMRVTVSWKLRFESRAASERQTTSGKYSFLLNSEENLPAGRQAREWHNRCWIVIHTLGTY